MKTSSFLLALAVCAGTAMAQNSITNSVAGTFVDISGLAGAQALVAFDTDDGSFAFTSTVTNSVFASTNVHVCSNGFMQFGAATGATNYFNAAIAVGTTSPVTPNDAQALFPFWDDQYIRTAEGGNIYWIEGPATTFGLPAAAGNVLIVQWNSIDHYFDSAEPGTYQVQIFQNPISGSVVAQMLYQDLVYGDAVNYDNGISATVGFASGATGGAASVNNVQYSYNTVGNVADGTVLSLQLPTGPIAPTVAGAANPAVASPGDVVLYTATVSSGLNPASTGLQVRGDLTSVGGSATAAFHDDGLNGDAAAGDHVYSFRYTIPLAQPGGNYSVALTVTDAQARTGTNSFSGNIFNPTSLGTLVDGTATNVTVDLAATEVKWYRATISDCSVAALRNLRVTTENSVNGGDSEIGVYDSAGNIEGTNDDSGSLLSLLTFGYQGAYGDIGPGTIYIAVGSFNTNYTAPLTATSTGPGGNFELTLLQTHSFPPTAVGAFASQGGNDFLLTVAVTPGVNPDSTGIQVHGDLSGLGGSANQAFHDDGLNGDAAAGDLVFSYLASTPSADADGTPYTVNYTVTDQQSNNITGSIAFTADKVGQTIDTAFTPVGSGPLDSIAGSISFSGDADIYRINICDTGAFSATTGGNGTTGDTQLFLFTTDGMGVTFDDDNGTGLSTITGQFVQSTGDYLLAISRYDNDPQDASAQELWMDTPFAVERQPDGPGAGSPFESWGGFSGTGDYTITLTGACYATGGAGCGAADVGGVGGVQGADGHLDNNDFVVFIDLFFNHSPLADQGSTGGVHGSDGVWDNNDFVVFIDNFFTAPASCR